MDERPAADRGAAGGGAIPKVRAELAYLVTGTVAVALAVAGGLYVVASTPEQAAIFALPVIAGCALYVAGVALGRMEAVLWGAGGLAATYVASLLYRSAPPDSWSALVAAGLLLSCELASWSIDSRRRGRDDITVHAGRMGAIALVITVALALVLVVQTFSHVGGGGTASVALATIAVLVGAGAISLLMWRSAGAGGAAPDSLRR